MITEVFRVLRTPDRAQDELEMLYFYFKSYLTLFF